MYCLITFFRGAIVPDVSVLVEIIVIHVVVPEKNPITVSHYTSNKKSLDSKKSLDLCMLGLKMNLILL